MDGCLQAGFEGLRAGWQVLLAVSVGHLALACAAEEPASGGRSGSSTAADGAAGDGASAAAQVDGAAGGAGATGGAGTAGAMGTGDFGNSTATPPGSAPAMVLNPGGGDCAPGHYIGMLQGEYFSQVWGNGSVPIPFATGDMNGQPGMEFWLEQVDRECSEAEFCADFEIRGGKLRGWAIPNADDSNPMGGGFGVRFEMGLSGELDCRTGEFRGQLIDACYDVAGTLYRMEGILDASYDKASDAFVMGEWELTEMPLAGSLVPPDANIGGSGAWNAALADDGSSPIAEGDGLCDKASGFDTML